MKDGNGHARLRIAQVAPLHESVPPQLYGGTERVVAYLTNALVALGHDVTLFASGDSVTDAKLVATVPHGLRLAGCADTLSLHFPTTYREGVRHVTTLHGRLDLPEIWPLYRLFEEMPVVSISDAQRAPMPWAAWQGTVYHGLPARRGLVPSAGEYLAFLGRICPEKGIDRAIEIARRAGMPLRVAAKIDTADRAYYERVIAPLMAQPHVEFVGEIGEAEKQAFLAGARALLFPVDWPEPFGMVLI